MIIDASVAFKWIAEEDGSDRAAALLGADRLGAPFLLLSEVGNALRKLARRGSLVSVEPFIGEVARLPQLVDLMDEREDVPMALRLASELDHSVYDCVYLAMALRLDEPLITADATFLRKLDATPYASRVQGL